jgi:hypothetical protein
MDRYKIMKFRYLFRFRTEIYISVWFKTKIKNIEISALTADIKLKSA